ncbi:MAG: hypothetical protein ACFFAU_16475 [Candidatus Hodarchaeota archaeon]
MKSFDVDAKQFIRNYVDSIEDYLRNHTRLHPNEIDGLLNEINDFVYLRSRELAEGERVRYGDVLRAIEECGSPSEICEQYLELDQKESIEPHTQKRVVFTPKTGAEETKIEETETEKEELIHNYSIDSSSRFNFESIRNSYRNALSFGIYRAFFVSIIGFQLFGFFAWRLEAFAFPSVDFIPALDFAESSYHICISLTYYIFLLILLECGIINRWKTRLVRKDRIYRKLDDDLVAFIARISFLIIFLKASLLLSPAFLPFIPFWIFMLCIVEKTLNTQLWQKKLSPWIVRLGIALSNKERSENFLPKSHFFQEEKIVALIPFIIFIISFGLSWFPLSYWTFFYGISIIGMILVLALLLYYRGKFMGKKDDYEAQVFRGESEMIIWLIRLLAIKTLMVGVIWHDFLFSYFHPYFQMLIVTIWIAIEIIGSTADSTKSWVGNLLIQIGSPELSQFKSTSIDRRSDKDSQELKSSVVLPTIENSVEDTSKSTSIQQVKQESTPSSQIIEIHKKESFGFFRFMRAMIKAITVSISMLIITIFEVVLVFSILLTTFTENGYYQLPQLQFDLSWISPRYSNVFIPEPNYNLTIFVWHSLLLLVIQIFVVAVLEYYGLATKSPEGVVVRLGRNLSRVLIIIIFIGSLARFAYYGVFYAVLELMLLSILFIFNELNAWKVRSERKHFEKSERIESNQTREVINRVNTRSS